MAEAINMGTNMELDQSGIQESWLITTGFVDRPCHCKIPFIPAPKTLFDASFSRFFAWIE